MAKNISPLQAGIDGVAPPSGDGIDFLFETSTTQKFPIGQRVCLSNGAVFHYAYALTAIGRQLFAAAGTVPAGHQGTLTLCSGTASLGGSKVGSKTLRIIASGTAMTENQYQGGQFCITTNVLGLASTQVCWIKSHNAAATGAACDLQLHNPLLFTVDSNARGNLIMNPFMNVKAHAGAAGNWPVGLTTTIVAATSYCWLQTWGPTGVVHSAMPQANVGGMFVCGTATGGAVSSVAIAGINLYPLVGYNGNVVGVSGCVTPAFITIMP